MTVGCGAGNVAPHQVTYKALATLIHVQRAGSAAYIFLCYRNQLYEPLEAVHCHIHGARYFNVMVDECGVELMAIRIAPQVTYKCKER